MCKRALAGILFRFSGVQPLQMHYFSTNRISPDASFREAVLAGQATDKGLYFPSEIPRLQQDFLQNLGELDNGAIAFEMIQPYVGGEIPDDDLFRICSETVDFDFPLVKLTDRIYVLELFHGPTLAFKDVGARFMSRCLQYFVQGRSEKTFVVVATSGDTGGAVAASFHGLPDVEVIILFPKGGVSQVQELQLTTLGGNVTTLELRGTFDDCQALAKIALADPELQSRANLTSANSINPARWLPQQFYFAFALKQWEHEPPVFAVPSGNFGNLAAGLLANASGLPAKGFIAACNANDVVPRYLASGKYEPTPSIPTLSNAMDVGAPSNWVRVGEILGKDPQSMNELLSASSISDMDTAATMRAVYEKTGYVLDPHGAVAYRALKDRLNSRGGRGILLETAHPAKFDSVADILGTRPSQPAQIDRLFDCQRFSTTINNDYRELKEVIASKI
jgi:threonine synthase